MEKLSVWFCGLYTTPCLTGLLYGYDTVSISGAIDFLQDKYGRREALVAAQKAALGRVCCVYWRIDHMGRLRADDLCVPSASDTVETCFLGFEGLILPYLEVYFHFEGLMPK